MQKKYKKILLEIVIICSFSFAISTFFCKTGGEIGNRFTKNPNNPLTWSEVYAERYTILRDTAIFAISGIISWFYVRKYILKK